MSTRSSRFLAAPVVCALGVSAAQGAAFVYAPLNPADIVSATVSVNLAALDGASTLLGQDVNHLRLVDLGTPGLPETDLSAQVFPISQGATGTGEVSASVPASFFAALGVGQVGLDALFTDTSDGAFAIDYVSLKISTASSSFTVYYGSTPNGFGAGIPLNGALPGQVWTVIPAGATGTGFDETISSKAMYVVPAPGVPALAGIGAMGLARRRRRRIAVGAAAAGLIVAGASMARDGTEPVGGCQLLQQPDPNAMCRATPPAGPDYQAQPRNENDYASSGSFNPAGYDWMIYDIASQTEVRIPQPGYDDDPNGVGQNPGGPGSDGCEPDTCSDRAVVNNPDKREQIVNTSTFPWRAIGQLRMKWDNGKWYNGTATLIAPNAIITCAHNIHDKNEAGATNKWCVEAHFAPGQTNAVLANGNANPNAKPYGEADVTQMYTYFGWTNDKDTRADLAICILNKNIGNTTGWFGYSCGHVGVGDSLQLSGYPGDKPSGTQWWTPAPITAVMADNFRHTGDTFRGHSGSPMWWLDNANNRFIEGVHTGLSNSTLANPNWGTRITGGRFRDIGGWLTANPPPAARGPGAGPCDNCGADCNANGIPDNIDILLGTSQDANHDGIPDECQAQLFNPADQLHLVGPVPQVIQIGGSYNLHISVEKSFAGLASRNVALSTVGVACAWGSGLADPSAGTTTLLTDSNGGADVSFTPSSQGQGLLKATIPGSGLTAYYAFSALPVVFRADINGDCAVNTSDLATLLSQFGSSTRRNAGGDLNGDGVVNTLDLAILLGQFGKACP